jgi:hypothetical protein
VLVRVAAEDAEEARRVISNYRNQPEITLDDAGPS